MTDSSHSTNSVVAFCTRLYPILLVAYPADFRRTYGPQMGQVFRDCCRDTYQRRGSRGLVALCLTTLGDLLVSACAERITRAMTELRHETERQGDRSMAVATVSNVAVGKGRLRISIVMDVAVCAMSFLSFVLCSDVVRNTLVAFTASLALSSLWLAIMLHFASRGQTIGLASVKVRWRGRDDRSARRRLLGEPQFWCAALPAVFFLLVPPLFILESTVQVVAWHAWHVVVDTSTWGQRAALITAGCALVVLVTSRKHPARIVYSLEGRSV